MSVISEIRRVHYYGYSFVGPPLVGWPKDAVRAKQRRPADKRRPYKESPDSGGVVIITMAARKLLDINSDS
jgi:hypothetical protein